MKSGWKVIGGFGSHIKATRENLIIQHKGEVTEIPLNKLDHLLITGGHNIQSAAIGTLIGREIFISFCESDGRPVGYIRPYQDTRLTDLQKLQDTCPAYSVALHCARSAIADRILAIETWIHTTHKNLLFSGELDILSQAADELENLVRIEELRRIDRLVSDMYYEIFSRLFDPVYGFRRRTDRPYRDPMNAILSYGYGMLAASCTRSLVGAFLNPDGGMLNRGEQSLTLDLINCWKTGMIDLVVLSLAESGCIRSAGYECSSGRCIISEGLINTLISSFQESIQKEVIDLQVQGLVKFLKGEAPFEMYRYRGLL